MPPWFDTYAPRFIQRGKLKNLMLCLHERYVRNVRVASLNKLANYTHPSSIPTLTFHFITNDKSANKWKIDNLLMYIKGYLSIYERHSNKTIIIRCILIKILINFLLQVYTWQSFDDNRHTINCRQHPTYI